MLQSPYFLYRSELGAAGAPLSAYEIAAKLSLWLRNTTPDDALLDAAAGPGKLDTAAGAATVAQKMLDDPAAKAVMRKFHGEFLHFDKFDQLSKVGVASYNPAINPELKESSYLFFDKIFNQMDRAVVHGSTFAKNDLAMAAGIATLEVIKAEKLVELSARRGAELKMALTRMVPGYELMKEVRGKGLMIGVEFGPPKSLRLKASWNVLETANKGLFCQLITVPLFKDHKILTQVAGHGSHTIKLLPPLVITEEDCNWIAASFDTVIAGSHKVPGAIWSLGKTLVDNAVRKSA